MLGPELVDMVAVFAWGHTLRQQQKEETIRAEFSDGIRRLSSRCRVRFSGIYGSRARVAKNMCASVVGVVCKTQREACEELRAALLDNPFAPFSGPIPDCHQNACKHFVYRWRWGNFARFTQGRGDLDHITQYPAHAFARFFVDSFVQLEQIPL